VVVKTKQPAIVRLRLLHHPAWSVTVDGKPAKTKRTVSYNAILVPIRAGESRIEAHFTRTTDRTIGGWMSAGSFVGAGLLVAWPFKRTSDRRLAAVDGGVADVFALHR